MFAKQQKARAISQKGSNPAIIWEMVETRFLCPLGMILELKKVVPSKDRKRRKRFQILRVIMLELGKDAQSKGSQ